MGSQSLWGDEACVAYFPADASPFASGQMLPM
jgi:hypothetical protein